jgi:hypothetical protein
MVLESNGYAVMNFARVAPISMAKIRLYFGVSGGSKGSWGHGVQGVGRAVRDARSGEWPKCIQIERGAWYEKETKVLSKNVF